jgi:predicted DNA-binding protein (UPF0251 family)
VTGSEKAVNPVNNPEALRLNVLTNETSSEAVAPARPVKDETITRAEFARRMRVSKPAVTQAIKAERLHGAALADGKRLRFLVAAAQWTANRDPQAELIGPAPDDADDREDPGIGGGAAGPYRNEKAATEKVRRELLEIELGRAKDRYRDRDEVAQAETTAGRQIAQHLELIESWAEELAVESDPMAVRRKLRDLIRGLRQKIADALNGLDDETGEDNAGDMSIIEETENAQPIDA